MNRNRILVAIAQGEITRKAAAEEVGVTPRTINRWMTKQNVKRPLSKRARERDRLALKERSRRLIIKGTIGESPRVPAALLDLSVRTIMRLRKKYELEALR